MAVSYCHKHIWSWAVCKTCAEHIWIRCVTCMCNSRIHAALNWLELLISLPIRHPGGVHLPQNILCKRKGAAVCVTHVVNGMYASVCELIWVLLDVRVYMRNKIFASLRMYAGIDQDILRRGDRNRNDQQAGTLACVCDWVCMQFSGRLIQIHFVQMACTHAQKLSPKSWRLPQLSPKSTLCTCVCRTHAKPFSYSRMRWRKNSNRMRSCRPHDTTSEPLLTLSISLAPKSMTAQTCPCHTHSIKLMKRVNVHFPTARLHIVASHLLVLVQVPDHICPGFRAPRQR